MMLERYWRICLLGLALVGVGKNAHAQGIERRGIQPIFELGWQRDMVRRGMDRAVLVSALSPAISKAKQTLWAATGEGWVSAHALTDGSVIWRRKVSDGANGVVTLLPPLGDGPMRVLVGGHDGIFRALDGRNGDELWRVTLRGDVSAPGVVAADGVYLLTDRDALVALNRGTGAIRWVQSRPRRQGLAVRGVAKPALAGAFVLAGYTDGYLAMHRRADGSEVWGRALQQETGSASLGADFADVDAGPVVGFLPRHMPRGGSKEQRVWSQDGLVFAASHRGGLFAMALSDGRTVWHRPWVGIQGLAFSSKALWVASSEGWLQSLSPRTGAPQWKTLLPMGSIAGFAVRDGYAAWVGSQTGLTVVDAHSGEPLQALRLAERFDGPLVWQDGYVAFSSSLGRLFVAQGATLRAGRVLHGARSQQRPKSFRAGDLARHSAFACWGPWASFEQR